MSGEGKLVRNRIPELILASGQAPIVRTAAEGEWDGLLRAKLQEEVQEFLDAPLDTQAEELADILEVLLALSSRVCELRPQSPSIVAARSAKLWARGSFSERLVWMGNEAPSQKTGE